MKTLENQQGQRKGQRLIWQGGCLLQNTEGSGQPWSKGERYGGDADSFFEKGLQYRNGQRSKVNPPPGTDWVGQRRRKDGRHEGERISAVQEKNEKEQSPRTTTGKRS